GLPRPPRPLRPHPDRLLGRRGPRRLRARAPPQGRVRDLGTRRGAPPPAAQPVAADRPHRGLGREPRGARRGGAAAVRGERARGAPAARRRGPPPAVPLPRPPPAAPPAQPAPAPPRHPERAPLLRRARLRGD